MKNVIFTPWVGKNYSKEENKILILGESHYSDTDFKEKTDFTTDIINIFLQYKLGNEGHQSWMNTFTKFTNVLNEGTAEIQELENFWNSIMFYNYVQKAVKGGARVSPSKNDFDISYLALKEVLNKYKPKTIIIWGNRLWNHLPNDDIKLNNETNIYHFKTGNVDAEILTIHHPSSTSFNRNWQEMKNKPKTLQKNNLKNFFKNNKI